METSIYQTCYDLVQTYIFGSVQVGSYQELVCIIISAAACIFVFSLPFLIVWRFLKLLGGK